jgi:protein SCO1/2
LISDHDCFRNAPSEVLNAHRGFFRADGRTGGISAVMNHCVTKLLLLIALAMVGISCGPHKSAKPARSAPGRASLQVFAVTGTVQELKSDAHTIVVKHAEIPDYMAAMTMPFRAKASNEISALQPGDEITFRLSVTSEESWIDHVRKTGLRQPIGSGAVPEVSTNLSPETVNVLEALSAYTLTNEFGRAVKLSDCRGQAIGFTFFFTRCPIPEYCPRLTKNFVGATAKLKAMPDAPTNWHLFSISFDPEFDTPAVLRGYGRMYGYDSNHWSFLTGAPANLREITARFGFSVQKSPAGFDHNFLTVVLDARGYVQGAWPIGGDTTDNLVAEIVKAASATNRNTSAP